MVRIQTILFGSKYDLIFFMTKSAAVCLFYQYKIKLMIWSARKITSQIKSIFAT